MKATISSAFPSIVCQLRRRAGIQKMKMKARPAPPAACQETPPGRFGSIRAALVAGVVEMVRFAVAAAEPLMGTGLVAPTVKLGAGSASSPTVAMVRLGS